MLWNMLEEPNDYNTHGLKPAPFVLSFQSVIIRKWPPQRNLAAFFSEPKSSKKGILSHHGDEFNDDYDHSGGGDSVHRLEDHLLAGDDDDAAPHALAGDDAAIHPLAGDEDDVAPHPLTGDDEDEAPLPLAGDDDKAAVQPATCDGESAAAHPAAEEIQNDV